ncbi:hypothetical protein Meth11DRAFT_1807 [Methylophilaceae bacterium 11]|jgi:hypothetical protein|nr:hypothetical protein Meth11DRAFT_1807 [Methylophilaceae bacterium 11]
MKNITLKLAVLSAMTMLSAQVMATGLVALPSAGLAVSAGTNQPAGTTPYVTCNPTGNYGAQTPTAPSAGANNDCAVFLNTPATFTSVNASPVSGYTLIQSVNASVVNANGTTLAKRWQKTFRTSDQKMCVYATQFQMDATSTFDYDGTRAGTNTLEVNDIAFAGFSTNSSVNAGYYFSGAGTSSPVYRVGRSHTSVQMHSNAVGGASVASTFVLRPITTSAPAASTQINGPSPLGTEPYPNTATAGEQAGALSPNWVIFTLDLSGGPDEDGAPADPYSPWMYIEAACKDATPLVAGTPAALTDGIVLRQSGQETQPWVTVKTPSTYAPQSASATLY